MSQSQKTVRKIPSTMATQHPDHASSPTWQKGEFISTLSESKECYHAFKTIGADEYNWDWEGKLVDEAVIERLYTEFYEYFKENPIGKDKFLTFRLPNPDVETECRLGRAFMGILTACATANAAGLHSPPLFEVIIPMVTNAKQLIDIHEAYGEVSHLRHKLLGINDILNHLEIIPLVEDIHLISKYDELIEQYVLLHQQKFKFKPKYIRPYIARSDPALNSGLIPTVLAIKLGLSKINVLQNKLNIPLYPMIGCGTLPFRGGLNPTRVINFINEYKGISTTTIQSAFQYDFDIKIVKKAVKALNSKLQKNKALHVNGEDEKKIYQLMKKGEQFYKNVIGGISQTINKIALYIPKRRERVQHIGLFGYSRGDGKIKLPRAITFTASLYSIGIPPEFIGSGQLLKYAMENNLLEVIKKYYLNIKNDFIEAGRYLNRDNLNKLRKNNEYWESVWKSIELIEKILKIELVPKTYDDHIHIKLTSIILQKFLKNMNMATEIDQAAKLRRSLG